MGQYRYVTNRSAVNKAGEAKGKIRVLVKQGSDTAEVDYVCPECSMSEHKEQAWIKPFSIKCSKCSFVIKLPKLKDEIKKDKKRKKA